MNEQTVFDRREWRMVMWPRALVLLAVVLFTAVLFTVDGSGSQSGNPAGGDFPAFYSAGDVALHNPDPAVLYDPVLQRARQDDLVGPGSQFLPWAYPPHVAVLYAPLSMLPYRLAYIINSVLMVAALAVALVMLRPMLPFLEDRSDLVLLMCVAFIPLGMALVIGQNITVTILLLVLVWRALHDNNEIAAGVAAGLMMYKPQYAVPVIGLLFIGRYGKAVAAAVTVSAVTALVSTVVFGMSWLNQWLAMTSHFANHEVRNLAPYKVNAAGFAEAVFGTGTASAVVVGYLSAAAVVVTLIWLWMDSHNRPLDALMSATALGVVIAAPYSMFYGSAVLVFPILVVMSRNPKRWAWLPVAVLFTGLSTFYARTLHFAPYALMLVGLFVWSAWTAAKETTGGQSMSDCSDSDMRRDAISIIT